MSTGGLFMQNIGWGCQSLNYRKYAVLNGKFLFDLRYIFLECKPGVKRDLPVQANYCPDITINNAALRAKYLLYYSVFNYVWTFYWQFLVKIPIMKFSQDPSGRSRALPRGLMDDRTDSELLLANALQRCMMRVFYGQWINIWKHPSPVYLLVICAV